MYVLLLMYLVLVLCGGAWQTSPTRNN